MPRCSRQGSVAKRDEDCRTWWSVFAFLSPRHCHQDDAGCRYRSAIASLSPMLCPRLCRSVAQAAVLRKALGPLPRVPMSLVLLGTSRAQLSGLPPLHATQYWSRSKQFAMRYSAQSGTLPLPLREQVINAAFPLSFWPPR